MIKFHVRDQRGLLISSGGPFLESRGGSILESVKGVKGERKTSALFIDLVRAVGEAYPDAKRLHFILDNAATHSSRKTNKALEQMGGRVVLHFLPPYCPEGNRIERVWWDVHANVTRNHRCKKMQALMSEVDAYLDARNVQQTASPMLRAAPARRAA